MVGVCQTIAAREKAGRKGIGLFRPQHSRKNYETLENVLREAQEEQAYLLRSSYLQVERGRRKQAVGKEKIELYVGFKKRFPCQLDVERMAKESRVVETQEKLDRVRALAMVRLQANEGARETEDALRGDAGNVGAQKGSYREFEES